MFVSVFVVAITASPLPQSTLPARLPQSTLTVAAAPADDQLQAYRELCRWAEEHPGKLVIVYVKADPPADGQDYVERHCRYDAGWPNVTTPTKVVAVFRDGQFMELRREPIGNAGVGLTPSPSRMLSWGGAEISNTARPTPASFRSQSFPARPQLLQRFGRIRGGTCGAGGCH